jgi:hypothetical protein
VSLFRRDPSDWPQGRATVLDEHGVHPARLDLQVEMPPAASYRVRVQTEPPLGLGGTLTGRVLPVRVHPRKRDRIEILWQQAGLSSSEPESAAPVAPPAPTLEAPPTPTEVSLDQFREVLSQAGVTPFTHVEVQNSQEQLGKNTADGQATILSIGEPLLTVAGMALVELRLRVLVAGSRPRELHHETMLAQERLAALQVGSWVPVSVDRDRPDVVVLRME